MRGHGLSLGLATVCLGSCPPSPGAAPVTSAPATSPAPTPVVSPSPAPAPPASGAPPVLLEGPCEASAIVPWKDGFLVGDNETEDRLFLFSATLSPAGTLALPQAVGDIEALAVSGDTLWVVGSHSRNNAGEVKKKRHRILRFPDVLVEPDLSACAACVAAEPLGPNAGGLNIEGAAVLGGHLWVGLRSPLVGGKALLLDLGADARAVERQVEVDLGGLGVRDLMPSGEGFLILAGPVADGGWQHSLFRVGRPGDAPTATGVSLPTSAEGVAPRGAELVYVVDGDGKAGACKEPSGGGVVVLPP